MEVRLRACLASVLAPRRMAKLSKAKLLGSVCAPALVSAMSLAASNPALAACTGPGAPTTSQTACLTAIQIPGNALRSFDISWVNPAVSEYYLADRSNAGITIIDTANLVFKRTIGGFVGIKLTSAGAVNNNLSGPDGVTSHGRWLYAGDGDSTLKVIDLAAASSPIKQSISTGGTTRLDEMALTGDGKLLLGANNAEDPPFGTLFAANGDDAVSHVSVIARVTVDPTIIPPGFGLSIEQPAWDPTTKRFYTSVPFIANNPPGCNYGQLSGPITCEGGLLITDPTTVTGPIFAQGAYDPTTNTGVFPVHLCSPNGATVGPNDNLLLGCTPGNNPGDTTTLVINGITKNYANIGNITGSDEVWFNAGDSRYYLGASKSITPTSVCTNPNPFASPQKFCAVLGVVDSTSILIETIPQGSGSHSVAADSNLNRIFVPQVAPVSVVGAGGDTTTVGAGICGSTNGCVAVYAARGASPGPPPPPPPPAPTPDYRDR
jgi:hypothetical protein